MVRCHRASCGWPCPAPHPDVTHSGSVPVSEMWPRSMETQGARAAGCSLLCVAPPAVALRTGRPPGAQVSPSCTSGQHVATEDGGDTGLSLRFVTIKEQVSERWLGPVALLSCLPERTRAVDRTTRCSPNSASALTLNVVVSACGLKVPAPGFSFAAWVSRPLACDCLR